MLRSVTISKALKGLLLAGSLFSVFATKAQTTVMSPSVNDGGFESATTTWTFVQNTTSTTDANAWTIGSTSTGTNIPGVVTGSNAAYVTTGATGLPWAYEANTVARASHMYKDITFNAGDTVVTMSFNWRGRGESGGWDNLIVYLAPTTFTPTTSSPSGSSNALTGADILWSETVPSSLGSYTLVSFAIPQSLIGNGTAAVTKRLIFTWKNDNGGGSNPPIAIDDITIIASCQPVIVTGPTAISNTSATLGWTAMTGATGYNVRYKLKSDPATVTTWATPTSITSGTTTTLAISSLTASSAYEYQVSAVGASCTAYSNSYDFSTICSTVAVPQYEGFNTAAATTFPTCWTASTVTPSSNATPAAITFETSGTAPTTSPFAGTRMVKFNSSSNNGGVMRLSSLPLSTTGVPNVDVNFQWREDVNSSYSSGTYLQEGVQVQYSINGGATWTDAGSLITRAGAATAWVKKTVTLPSGAGNQSAVIVGLKFTSKFGDNQYLDSLSVEASPSCVKPTSLTATLTSSTSASIVWVAPAIGTTPIGYEYVVSTSSTTPAAAAGTGTLVTTT
ncbi:MAG: hypothetical protein EOP51_28100, partial [Sphingobacteriales bacterium]